MGLLDRWSKKTQKEQLDETANKVVDGVVTEKTVSPKAKTKKVEEKKSDVKIKASSLADKILIRPLVTEKAAIAESRNQYGFVVAREATKIDVKKAVEESYGVKPESVNIVNVSGKTVRFGRSLGRRSDYKKALVTLPQGKTINIHEGV